MSTSILIRNGRVIDPAQEIDEVTNLAIQDGKIAALGAAAPASAEEVIDADGLIVAPGLLDMHVHLREPGFEESETIETGTAAAAAGGFTAVACMPNTEPPLDNDAAIEFVLRQAARAAHTRVYPIGALTKGREGKELAEIGLMVRAGAVAFSDDGVGIADASVCLRAMRYVSMCERLFIQHCEEPALAGGGCMHAGPTATRLGLPGISGTSEVVMAQRDITLAAQAGVRYHVAHVSTAGTVELVRKAKQEGRPVSAEVCPHHLLLTDEACATYNANYKVNPPLRSRADVEACLAGVRDGTIDCLVTDHAPHRSEEKEHEFQFAPFGMIGLEIALPLFIQALIEPGIITWPRLITAMSTRPAQLLGVTGGTLTVGQPADVTLIDPRQEWTIDAERMRSKCSNTPFDGRLVRGRAAGTLAAGAWRFRTENLSSAARRV
ncbi:MAG: dihydroorotase [Phycisphaerae bacterium]|nr:dihydroorotase [Phycisphaerae bacterium]